MKRTKKIVTLALAMVLLVCTTIMATVAYLQSTTKVVKNTFTVGKVAITLDEARADLYGNPLKQKVDTEGNKVTDAEGNAVYEICERTAADRVITNDYKLIPSHEYVKDPTVHVAAGSEESYIRMIVTISDLEDVKAVLGVDEETKAFLPQYFVKGWDDEVWVSTKNILETTDTATYEFRYYKTVNTLELQEGKVLDLEPLFTDIVVPEGVDNENLAKLEELEINVIAHAIQADGFADADEAWAAFE